MRLVLCDDNRILCEALAVALEARGYQVVAITSAAADGLAAVGEHRPDVVLLDLRFPGGINGADGESTEGLSAAGAIRQHYPDTAVLVLSGLADRATWSAAMKLGVAGFLCKDHNVTQIAAALNVISAGGVVFDPMVRSQVGVRPPSRRRASAVVPAHPAGEGGAAPHHCGPEHRANGRRDEYRDQHFAHLREERPH